MILAITVCKVKVGYRGRVVVVISTKVRRWRIRERRGIKEVLVIVRLSKLVHVATMTLGNRNMKLRLLRKHFPCADTNSDEA